jgi:hypothetical protein
MKTFETFLEATIVPPKDAKRAADNVASSDKMAQKLTAIQQKRQNERIKQKKYDAPLQTRPGKQLPADKGSAIVRTKTGGTGKEAVGAPKKSGPGVIQNGGALAKTKNHKEPIDAKTFPPRPADEKQQGTEPGKPRKLSVYDKEKEKIRARKDSEKKTGGQKFRSFLGKTAKVAGNVAKAASKTNMGQTETESGQSLSGSYDKKDTQI